MSNAEALAISRGYREAAAEHINRLEHLHRQGFYVLSHYAAGVAVECLLRAYRVLVDPVFDSRHNIMVLNRDARFFDFVPYALQDSVHGALGEVATRWSNKLRYRSGRAIVLWLKAAGIDGRMKGDPLKLSSRRIVDASILIVTTGLLRWKDSSNS